MGDAFRHQRKPVPGTRSGRSQLLRNESRNRSQYCEVGKDLSFRLWTTGRNHFYTTRSAFRKHGWRPLQYLGSSLFFVCSVWKCFEPESSCLTSSSLECPTSTRSQRMEPWIGTQRHWGAAPWRTCARNPTTSQVPPKLCGYSCKSTDLSLILFSCRKILNKRFTTYWKLWRVPRRKTSGYRLTGFTLINSRKNSFRIFLPMKCLYFGMPIAQEILS